MELKEYLGDKSYLAIVDKIKEMIKSAEADTKEGNKMISELYTKLNESYTPMLSVKDFIINSANCNDSRLQDVVDYCKKEAQSTDLNYIINICKEEHLDNCNKYGVINPIETIKSKEYLFEIPSFDVKQAIINGEYDNLNSPLLNNIKKSLGLKYNKIQDNQKEITINNDYENVKSNVFTYIFKLKNTNTIQGTTFVNKLNEAIKNLEYPILSVIDILNEINNIQIIKDEKLNEIYEYISVLINNNDVNYLINLSREDYLKNNLPKTIGKEYYNIIETDSDILLDEISYGNYDWLSKSQYFLKLCNIYNINYQLNNIDKKLEIDDFVGKNGYNSIVNQIKQKFANFDADTITGNTMIHDIYNKLNESDNITPMLKVKEFITGAQNIAKDDVKLNDIINFCKKKATEGDLNYIINLCKEEHFQNLKRAGHPDPQKTISEIENYFNQPASVIEKAIHDGIFDRLNSKLLNDIKASLKIEIIKQPEDGHKLNEGFNGYCEYSPLGIMVEIPNQGICVLCESDILSFNKEYEEFKKLDENFIEQIPQKHKRLISAINELVYEPNKMEFSLNESWDFNLKLNKDGKAFIGLNEDNMREINSKDLRKLLLESIHEYENKGGQTFNKQKYMRDADNFVCIMENHSNIACIDNLKVIRNLNESTYIMYDVNDIHATNEPKLLSINGKSSTKYNSFRELNESIKNIIGFDCYNLFESEINIEYQQLEEKQKKITSLMEQQKEINEQIKNVENLKKLADFDSPAMDRLNEQHNILNQALQKNFDDLNFYQNEF